MTLQFNDYLLLILLLLSLYFDLTRKKIPNFLTFPVIIWGLFYYTITAGFHGFLFSLYGLLLGIALFIVPFALGGMGGGDVKLLGAIGAVKGAQFVFHAALVTALCGGLLAVIYLITNQQFCSVLKRILGLVAIPFFDALYFKFGYAFFNKCSLFFTSPSSGQNLKRIYLPYGVAIALGTIIVLCNPVIHLF